MEPREIAPAQWDQIDRSIVSLAAFVGLGLSGALAFLLGRAVIPSIAADELAGAIRWIRLALLAVGALGLLGAVVALAFGLALAVGVLRSVYPRFLV